jgi:hypothetical protein
VQQTLKQCAEQTDYRDSLHEFSRQLGQQLSLLVPPGSLLVQVPPREALSQLLASRSMFLLEG